MPDAVSASGSPEADLAFGHYRVLRRPDGSIWELGRGAMGVNYKAFDEQLRIDVALKVINPAQLGDAKTRALFLREARAAARVHQSNVANVVFLNPDPTNPFYAMEFIAGESLRDWMRSRLPLSPALAIGLTEQVARGLQAIHAENVVHRDLKPGNVMVVRSVDGREKGASDADPSTWQAKIIDFGLAREFSGRRPEQQCGRVDDRFSRHRDVCQPGAMPGAGGSRRTLRSLLTRLHALGNADGRAALPREFTA